MNDVKDATPSRISLRDLSVLNESSSEEEHLTTLHTNYDERQWRLSYLKGQFKSFELNKLFKRYFQKVRHGYFSLFLILQGFLGLIHFLVLLCSILVNDKDNFIIVLPDLILYATISALSCLGLYVVDRVAEKYNRLQYLATMAFVLIFFMNAFVPFYHRLYGDGRYRSTYSAYLTISCYVFFGVNNLMISFIMGLFVSVFHVITLILVTYTDVNMLWQRIFSDAIFLAFLNGLGIYFRYMNEIVIRRSFLDRRDCIMSTFQLNHEKEQMETLMSSIIPKYVVNKVQKNYIETTMYFLKHKKLIRRNPFDNSLLDEHEDVTILFADIVHYTEMTIKLNITELLETLNDLFGLFDESSARLQVTRIKFLGDCYYCVAGLPPTTAANHAEACVDLGLEMIAIIAKVRKKRNNLNVNMRIGVHSGKIISGIIGSIKYQFDIWSKDVDIANKMESEGSPGKVHITNKTKERLTKDYSLVPTNKGETVPQFKQNNLQTFLVSPINGVEPVSLYDEIDENYNQQKSVKFKRQRSGPNGILLDQLKRSASINSIQEIYEGDSENTNESLTIADETNKTRPVSDIRDSTIERMYKRRVSNSPYRSSKLSNDRRSTNNIKRRTAFMNNNIKRYTERTEAVNSEMEKTINDISFSKYQQYARIKDISPLLIFDEHKTEMEYITIPDPLFKYYLLSAVGLIFCVYLLQNLTLPHWDLTKWPFIGTLSLIIFVFLPLAWTHFICTKYVENFADTPPTNVVIQFLCEASNLITNNFFIRLFIFTLTYVLFCACVLTELLECKTSISTGEKTTIKTNMLLLLISNPTTSQNMECVMPWDMTETCALTVIMTFLFMRIFIWIKLVYAIIVLIVYGYCVLNFSERFYKSSETFNYSLDPKIAHIMSTFFLTFTLHLIDRQTDYMNRLDHLMNKKVRSEQEEANGLQYVNENLLLNILPKHVAKIYLDINREMKDLYFEEHNDVAVMFASIIVENDLQDSLGENRFLILMNEYITSFDTLTNRKEFRNIEKIKIAKWTYMVACGLFEIERHITSSSLQTLLMFASEMYKMLDNVNRTNFQCSKLRIGISHGPIVAGVVGSKKPLYDIWGNAVNMASRMDSTGEPDRIQVMKETAEIIQRLGYNCEFRGKTFVKGRDDLVETYFVDLDRNHDLVRNSVQSRGD